MRNRSWRTGKRLKAEQEKEKCREREFTEAERRMKPERQKRGSSEKAER